MKRFPVFRIFLPFLIPVSAVCAQESANQAPVTSAETAAVPTLELRIAEDSPAQGLTPASVHGDEEDGLSAQTGDCYESRRDLCLSGNRSTRADH